MLHKRCLTINSYLFSICVQLNWKHTSTFCQRAPWHGTSGPHKERGGKNENRKPKINVDPVRRQWWKLSSVQASHRSPCSFKSTHPPERRNLSFSSNRAGVCLEIQRSRVQLIWEVVPLIGLRFHFHLRILLQSRNDQCEQFNTYLELLRVVCTDWKPEMSFPVGSTP